MNVPPCGLSEPVADNPAPPLSRPIKRREADVSVCAVTAEDSGDVRALLQPTVPQSGLISLQRPGHFSIGCNYWASHAGTDMWRNWRSEVVESDFAQLAANGLQLVRVFPLWPDFQPITQLRGCNGARVEIRLGEEPLPEDEIGRAGVSVVMLERFAFLCEAAERHGLKLIVGLVTGWMSGRLFMPAALEGLDPITNTTSIAWQTKLVRAIVRHARHQPAILAWDLGNECNCMGVARTRDDAYVWTAAITHAIRVADASRPVVSGMHAIATPTCNVPNSWMIDDQAELTDILTTHPYPYWIRHASNDAVGAFRTSLHATAETRFYGDIGGKSCFAEEIGTMGPMVASDHVSADFARVNLFSLWANDCRAFMWWCSHDQTELAHAPYDWNGVELELGLLRTDGSAKPVLEEMGAFRRFLQRLPFEALPRRRTEAVCLLSHGQDAWGVAFGAFVLAKQARLEIEFRHVQQEIPDSEVYLLPSIQGPKCIPRRKWLELVERVRAGASLYLSLGDGIVPHFNEIAGVELLTRGKSPRPLSASFNETLDGVMDLLGADDLSFAVGTAQVLATRIDNGQPAFWRNRVGAGMVYVLTAPLEQGLSLNPGSFCAGAPAYWKIYDTIAVETRRRWFDLASPDLAITEHKLAEDRVVVVAINHTGRARNLVSQPLAAGTQVGKVWRGAAGAGVGGKVELSIPAHDACVFELTRAGA